MMKFIKNRYVIFAACLLLAGIIAFVIVPSGNKRNTEMIDVVKAVNVIDKNTVITDEMLKIEQYPKNTQPQSVITDKKTIIGKIAAVTILPEDNLIPQKFSDLKSITDMEFYKMNSGEKLAVSVTVPSLAAGVSAKLLPGDVVSVYGFINDTKELKAYEDLTYVEVLAVTNSSAEDLSSRTANSESDTTDKVIPAAITFSVNRNQARELIELEKTGTVHIAFVGRGAEIRKLLTN